MHTNTHAPSTAWKLFQTTLPVFWRPLCRKNKWWGDARSSHRESDNLTAGASSLPLAIMHVVLYSCTCLTCVCLCWYLPSAVSYLFPAHLIIQCLLTEDSAVFSLWTFPVFILIGRLKMWLRGDDDTQQREWLYPSVGEANVWPSEIPGQAWWRACLRVL